MTFVVPARELGEDRALRRRELEPPERERGRRGGARDGDGCADARAVGGSGQGGERRVAGREHALLHGERRRAGDTVLARADRRRPVGDRRGDAVGADDRDALVRAAPRLAGEREGGAVAAHAGGAEVDGRPDEHDRRFRLDDDLDERGLRDGQGRPAGDAVLARPDRRRARLVAGGEPRRGDRGDVLVRARPRHRRGEVARRPVRVAAGGRVLLGPAGSDRRVGRRDRNRLQHRRRDGERHGGRVERASRRRRDR